MFFRTLFYWFYDIYQSQLSEKRIYNEKNSFAKSPILDKKLESFLN